MHIIILENVLHVRMNLPKYTRSLDMHNSNTRTANTLRSVYSRIEITKRKYYTTRSITLSRWPLICE
nr:unnamed protein product [Callosobruchus analis]CAI5870561.1 unnamed protein product [Callosobruchus analis]